MSIEINGREKEREKREEKDSLMSGHSGADFGSFQIGRSNFFRGNLDTVNEVSMMTMGDMKNTLLPVSKSNLYGVESPTQKRRSSFSRYSIRENPSITINPSMQRLGDGLRENPSITINGGSIIKLGDEGMHSHRSYSRNSVQGEDNLLSVSSRTNSRQHSHSKSHMNSFSDESGGEQDNSILNPDGEHSPIYREIKKLKGCFFHNPFNEDQNNAESLVSLKMGLLKSNTLNLKSITQSKVFEDAKPQSKNDNLLSKK
jgi:hypothetical protein